MAKLEKTLCGDFDYILKVLDIAVLQGSASASYEDGSDYSQGGFRCSVRIYERYSYTGGNRVSLSLTLAGGNGEYHLTAITSGGSQGVFFKINHWGEDAFLDTIAGVVENFNPLGSGS